MSKILPMLMGSLLVLCGCSSQPPHAAAPAPAQPVMPAPMPTPPATHADDNLNAVAWTQTAPEHDLIYLETFRDAQAQLLEAIKDKNWDALPKDDRTTPYKNLNEADWAAWCKEERARALPGAVAFTQFAAEHGVAVIYISNRSQDLDAATLDNLRKVGLPVASNESFLGLGTILKDCDQVGTEKNCRRQLVGQRYRVLMQFGDQLGDFVTVLSNTQAGRTQAIAPYLDWIGHRWFVLPNPTYGSWEPALFNNEWSTPRDQRRQQKINALRID